jgi:hypothetical protein
MSELPNAAVSNRVSEGAWMRHQEQVRSRAFQKLIWDSVYACPVRAVRDKLSVVIRATKATERPVRDGLLVPLNSMTILPTDRPVRDFVACF